MGVSPSAASRRPESVIEFHELALNDLRQAQAWYREKSPRAAERFFLQTGRAAQRLLVDSGSQPVIGRDCHYMRISRFPFVLIYRVRSQSDVFVIAGAHTSRRRGYWSRRN